MSLMWALYWIEVVGSIGVTLTIISIVGFLFAFFLPLILLDFCIKGSRVWSIMKKYIAALTLLTFFSIFIPSTQTMYAMLAADAGEKLMQSEEVKQIGGKALKILNDKLDELSGDKKENEK